MRMGFIYNRTNYSGLLATEYSGIVWISELRCKLGCALMWSYKHCVLNNYGKADFLDKMKFAVNHIIRLNTKIFNDDTWWQFSTVISCTRLCKLNMFLCKVQVFSSRILKLWKTASTWKKRMQFKFSIFQ